MARTTIEWATDTLNHQSGCTKVSPACTYCYACTLSVRLSNMGQTRYDGVTNGNLRKPIWTSQINTDLEVLKKNFQKIRTGRTPKRYFYGSMTDLWHESLDVDGKELTALADEIALLRDCKAPTAVMFLTKRADRLLAWQRHHFPDGIHDRAWFGVTVENQKYADLRIPDLIKVNCGVHFLSCEPLLGQVILTDKWLWNLQWIIAGGESGHKARPSNPDWFRSLRDQALNRADSLGVKHPIPFHFKQWGEWDENGVRIGKKKAGRHLDGRLHDGLPSRLVLR